MRKDILKALAVCGMCFGVGFGTGYFVKKYLDENIEEDIEGFEPFDDEDETDEVDNDDPEVIKAKNKFVDAMDRFSKVVKEYNKYTEIPEEVEYEEYAAEREHPEDDEPDTGKKVKKLAEPYLITPDQYTDENLGYEKFAYTYYRFDNVLSDDNDDPLDPEEAFGNSILDFVKNKFPNGAVPVYIRNEETSCDYEIMLVDGYHSGFDIQPGGTD